MGLNRKVSERERAVAFEKFEKSLTARQREIVFSSLLTKEIEDEWYIAKLASSRSLHSPQASPMGYGPSIHQAMRALIGVWAESHGSRSYDKPAGQLAADRAKATELRAIKNSKEAV